MNKKNIIIIRLFLYRVLSWFLPGFVADKAIVLFTSPYKYLPMPRDDVLISKSEVISLDWSGHKIKGYHWSIGGELVLLAHGWSSNPLIFRGIINGLLESGKSVIAFDAPSHGQSSGSRMNAMDYTRFLHDIILKFNPTYVVGHSMGGSCLLFVMAVNKIRFKKAVIISSPPEYSCVINNFIVKRLNLSPVAQKKFIQKMEKIVGYKLNEFNISFFDPTFNQVGLRVHDKNDMEISFADGKKLQEQWSCAEEYITSSLGHNKILKDSKVTNKIINYINL